MARFESETVRVVRRNAPLLAIAAFCVTMLVAMWASRGFGAGGTTTIVGLFLFAWIWIRNPFPLEQHVVLVADGRGIYYGGDLVISREAIAAAHVQPDEDGPLVKIAAHDGRELTLRTPGDADARAILEALALDGRPTLAIFRARPFRRGVQRWDKGQAIAVASLVVIYVLLTRLRIGTAIAFAGPLIFFALQRLVSGRVLVGADGFRVDWFGTRRFVPFRDVMELAMTARAVGVTLRSGESIDLVTPMRHYADAGERDALHLALKDGVARAATSAHEIGAESIVGRGDRPIAEWLRAVRSLGEETNVGYRVAAVPAPALWRIVEDPTAEESARVGAAVALRPTLDEAGRARVRVAAEASTSPWVRIALEPVFAEGTDEELALALEDLDAEARASES